MSLGGVRCTVDPSSPTLIHSKQFEIIIVTAERQPLYDVYSSKVVWGHTLSSVRHDTAENHVNAILLYLFFLDVIAPHNFYKLGSNNNKIVGDWEII